MLSPFKIIPNNISNKAIVVLFNKVFTQAIKEGELDFLFDKWIVIKVNDIGLNFSLSLKDNQLIYRLIGESDLVLAGNSCEFLQLLAKKQDPDSLFFQRKLKMSGSTELGLFVKNFLDSFDTNSSFIGKNFNQIMQKGYPFLRKIICET